MLAFALSLICFFFWGLGEFVAIHAVRRVGAVRTTLWFAIVGLIAATLYVPAVLPELANYDSTILALNLALGLIFVFSNLIYSHAVSLSNASVVTTIGASAVVWTALLSSWLFDEHLSLLQWGCVALITIGLFFCTLDFSSLKSQSPALERGLMLALAATCGWTLYLTLIRIVIEVVGWFWPLYIALLCFPAVVFYQRFKGQPVNLRVGSKDLALLVLSALMIRFAEFTYNAAISHGYTALVAPVAGSYPVLVVLLTFLFLRERIRTAQLIGVGLTLLAIVILGSTAS